MKIGKSFGCKDSGEIFVVQFTVDYLKSIKIAWHELYKLILHVNPKLIPPLHWIQNDICTRNCSDCSLIGVK